MLTGLFLLNGGMGWNGRRGGGGCHLSFVEGSSLGEAVVAESSSGLIGERCC